MLTLKILSYLPIVKVYAKHEHFIYKSLLILIIYATSIIYVECYAKFFKTQMN